MVSSRERGRERGEHAIPSTDDKKSEGLVPQGMSHAILIAAMGKYRSSLSQR